MDEMLNKMFGAVKDMAPVNKRCALKPDTAISDNNDLSPRFWTHKGKSEFQTFNGIEL